MAGSSPHFDFYPGHPATQILTLFLDGERRPEPAIAHLTGLPPTVAARWTTVLTQLRLLDRVRDDLVQPGPPLRINDPLGADGPDRPDRTEVLTELIGISGGRARIGVLHDTGIAYLQMSTARGRTLTAGSTSAPNSALGQVLLAYSPDGVAGRLLDLASPESATAAVLSRDQLDLALSVVKLSGVAMTRDQPPTLDVAVPVFTSGGQVEIAVEISAGGFEDADSAAIDALRRLARRLSSAEDGPSVLPG